VVRLIDALEDSDDVQHVHTNFSPTEEVLAGLSA
jgi:transcriptional/translational regulatory protein YebC/TACO1